MTKIAFFFVTTLLAMAANAKTSGTVIQRTDVLTEAPYGFMVEKARAPIRAYFVSLNLDHTIDELYSINPSPLGRLFGPLLVGRMNKTSSPQLSCIAIFCKDLDVLRLLENEIQDGRLVLVSHDFNGVNAFVMGPYMEHTPIKSYFADSDKIKSPLVVTPGTTLDVLRHELVHAVDYEQGNLVDLFTLTANLQRDGELVGTEVSGINRFILEVRAYDQQRIFVMASHRPNEYQSNRKQDFTVSIETVPSETYKDVILREITLKVIQNYLVPMLDAIKSRHLREESKGKILSEFQKLMAENGPYSFNNLVKPRL